MSTGCHESCLPLDLETSLHVLPRILKTQSLQSTKEKKLVFQSEGTSLDHT